MAKLFNVEVNTINYHLKEIIGSHELEENRTIRKNRTLQNEGISDYRKCGGRNHISKSRPY